MAFIPPALFALRAEINALAPNRSTASDGWIGDPAHASRDSDHNPEPDGTVDAIDVTHDPDNGADMEVITDLVKDDPRMDADGSYIIWNWRIWSGQSWEDYNGSNGHTKHAHFSIADSVQNDARQWLAGKLEDEVTPEDIKKITENVRTIVQNNQDKTADAINRLADEIAKGRKAQTAALRRAVWASEGLSIEKMEELEAKLDEHDDDT